MHLYNKYGSYKWIVHHKDITKAYNFVSSQIYACILGTDKLLRYQTSTSTSTPTCSPSIFKFGAQSNDTLMYQKKENHVI